MKATENSDHGARNQRELTHGRAGSVAIGGALIGGIVWAATPLRQSIFQAGGHPSEGELFFRVYNAVLIVIIVLLLMALLRLRHAAPGSARRLFLVGWWMVLAGYVMMIAGGIPATILGGQAENIVRAGQDAGFLGAMLAGLGAIPLGIAGLRDGRMPRSAAVLFIATLPLGILASIVLGGMGVQEDLLGLPVTVLYGSAWVVLGFSWMRQSQASPGEEPPGWEPSVRPA